jgi:hypothetical protein
MSLALRRSARRWFGDTSVYARDPALPAFMADLGRPWGLPWRPEVMAAGLGQTYGEMAEELLPEIVRPDEPVDVLVVAFGVHDVRPGRSAATYLSSICPGEPNAFAICEQGTLAPFTALRLLRSYAATGAAGRGVLVVAEQSTLHYPPAADVVLPERHAAVALLLDPAGPGRLTAVRQHRGMSTVEDALAAEVAALAGGRGDVTLLTGPGLAGPDAAGLVLPDGVKHSPGPSGQPHTAPWWQLLDHDCGLVLLADADADAGELGLAAFDFTPADPTSHGGPPR